MLIPSTADVPLAESYLPCGRSILGGLAALACPLKVSPSLLVFSPGTTLVLTLVYVGECVAPALLDPWHTHSVVCIVDCSVPCIRQGTLIISPFLRFEGRSLKEEIRSKMHT
jgi:hypothetical protein